MTKKNSNSPIGLSVVQWQDLIASCARKTANTPYEINYGTEVRSMVRPFMSEFTTEEAWLFELNVGLFLLRKQSTGRHLGYFAQMAASDTLHAIESQLHNDLPPEIAVKQQGRLLETAAYIRDTATANAWSPPAYLDIYVELWLILVSSAADSSRLVKEELAHLAEGSGKENKLFPLVALAWMRFWLGEDQEAWRLLDAAERHGLEPGQVFRFLRQLEENDEWTRLEAWLSHCANEQVGRSPGSLGEYGHYWDAVARRLPEAEERMWSVIASLPPYCSSLYEEKLMRYGRFRQWIDYQLSHGSDPFGFRAKDLQPIEKEAPDALLPFYHQGVEKYVLLKNRDGYKRAVKLLKRLAKLYKKLKREQRWESYIETFASRYSRLRALQEELRRGGLIP
ncbi:hypothetical protein D3P07_19995 [Paenibacillus sp. 1011MAR3C5]|uniref:hypothetical protein n=1 Tax=Paenibacillus sp. 1011MAR3C5 TaxID=1675787 RepID=UPI000E6CF407|nr:hypothetical protein [Paenibacillus sp. 1011MAR3C5]RJE86392.1 hypothetical protein D3P07_19995 [Paenibacillus sp. 1011MAR3C5]